MHIMLANSYTSYGYARKVLGIKTLFSRGQSLCKKFASKSLKHEKFSKWFKLNENKTNNRLKQPKLCDVVTITNSPFRYLTRVTSLLNMQG